MPSVTRIGLHVLSHYMHKRFIEVVRKNTQVLGVKEEDAEDSKEIESVDPPFYSLWEKQKEYNQGLIVNE